MIKTHMLVGSRNAKWSTTWDSWRIRSSFNTNRLLLTSTFKASAVILSSNPPWTCSILWSWCRCQSTRLYYTWNHFIWVIVIIISCKVVIEIESSKRQPQFCNKLPQQVSPHATKGGFCVVAFQHRMKYNNGTSPYLGSTAEVHHRPGQDDRI